MLKLLTATILATGIMAGVAHAGCERNGVMLLCNGQYGTITPDGNVSMSDGRHGQLLDQGDFTNQWRSNRAPMAIMGPQRNSGLTPLPGMEDDDED